MVRVPIEDQKKSIPKFIYLRYLITITLDKRQILKSQFLYYFFKKSKKKKPINH